MIQRIKCFIGKHQEELYGSIETNASLGTVTRGEVFFCRGCKKLTTQIIDLEKNFSEIENHFIDLKVREAMLNVSGSWSFELGSKLLTLKYRIDEEDGTILIEIESWKVLEQTKTCSVLVKKSRAQVLTRLEVQNRKYNYRYEEVPLPKKSQPLNNPQSILEYAADLDESA